MPDQWEEIADGLAHALQHSLPNGAYVRVAIEALKRYNEAKNG